MGKSKFVFGSVLLVSALLIGCNEDTEKDTNKQEDSGASTVTAPAESLYTEYCASCHGEEMNRMNTDLKTVKDRLGKDEIIDIIKNGKNAMPGNLVNDAENEVLTNWLLAQ